MIAVMKVVESQLATMLAMQDATNSVIDRDWRDKNREWYRAIFVECAEMMDHIGWKWWKDIAADMTQARIEIVDIFHFGLSSMLGQNVRADELARVFVDELSVTNSCPEHILIGCESMAEATLHCPRYFALEEFINLMNLAGMDMTMLFKLYVSKNVLNNFRQSHGYKEGTYIKEWHGEEDNIHLERLMSTLDSSQPDFASLVLSGLEDKYAEVVAGDFCA